jgi:hypothetical protein
MTDRRAECSSHEQRRRERATEDSGTDGDDEGQRLHAEGKRCLLRSSAAVKPERDRVVTDAEDRGGEKAQAADHQATHCCAKRHRRHRQRPFALEPMRERDRVAGGDAGKNADQSEAEELARITPCRERCGEDRLSAKERALHDRGRDCTDDHTAEETSLRGAEDFLQCEDHSRDRRVEDCRDPGGDADRNHPAHEPPRQPQHSRYRGGGAAGDDDDRSLRSERGARAERKRRRQKRRHNAAPSQHRGVAVVSDPDAGQIRTHRTWGKAANAPRQEREDERRRDHDEQRTPRLVRPQRPADQQTACGFGEPVKEHCQDPAKGSDENDGKEQEPFCNPAHAA